MFKATINFYEVVLKIPESARWRKISKFKNLINVEVMLVNYFHTQISQTCYQQVVLANAVENLLFKLQLELKARRVLLSRTVNDLLTDLPSPPQGNR